MTYSIIMNSIFRKLASPFLKASIFRKGASGISSLFKKAPSLERIVGGVRKASNVANALSSNPILEGLAERQGFGNAFNLAKKGANRLNQVANVGEKGVNIRESVRGATRERDMNKLEKAKPFIPTGNPFDDARNFV